jgi:predicted ATP-grasp superfamily ATP-dependent carboligase
MTPVYVFNCDYNGLGLIHALGRNGIPVFALDSIRGIGTYSKYATFIKVPDPSVDVNGFINKLMDLNVSGFKEKPLLLPTNDHWAEAISLHKKILDDKFTPCVSDSNIIDLILDKYAFSKEAERLGIPVPKSWAVDDIRNCLQILEYPIAIKARKRRIVSNTIHGIDRTKIADKLRFIICKNSSDLEEYVRLADKYNIDCYCQEIVNGDSSSMRSIGIYANKGIVKGLFYGRKVRGYPFLFGDCIVGEALSIPEWARIYAQKLIRCYGYTGIAEIEFMEDRNTGKINLIEMNPRSWSWVEICPYAGVNLAYIAYQDLILKKSIDTVEVSSEKLPVRYSKVLQDFWNIIYRYKQEKILNINMSFSTWRKELKNIRTIYAEFPEKDPLVSIVAIYRFFKLMASNIIKLIAKNIILITRSFITPPYNL